MDKYKDIIIIVVLIAIVIMIFMLMRSNKKQGQMLSTLALGGSFTDKATPTKQRNAKQQEEPMSDDFTSEDVVEDKDQKKPKLRKIHKQILELFKDNVPKTTGQIKKALKDSGVLIDDKKLNNSIWNLKFSSTLLPEKIGKTNYWGPGEWFEDGLFLEEYAEKIPEYKKEDEESEKE